MFLEKGDPKVCRKRKVLSYYEEREGLTEFESKVEKYYRQSFYQAIDTAVSCIRNRFSRKTTLKIIRQWKYCF